MKTKTPLTLPHRPALHLLVVAGLLLGPWSMDVAYAQQKKDLIEMPLIKKFKEEKAAAAAEAAVAGSPAPTAAQKPGAEKASAKPEAEAPAHKPAPDKPAPDKPAPEKAASKAEKLEPEAAQKHKPEKPSPAGEASKLAEPADSEAPGKESVKQLRKALDAIGTPSKHAAEKSGEAGHATALPRRPRAASHAGAEHEDAAGAHEAVNSRAYIRARAQALARGETPPAEPAGHAEHAGHGGEVHWSYEGENGPQAWGKLKPEFSLCASGKRQSPIAIQDEAALLGPAEPVQFRYTPSTGSVVNNGHTVQVDLEGDNSITVRNATFKLLQFHFHTPSEEMVNAKRYAMVAHLVHKNEAGQLAVVAVLLEQGEPNSLIDKVWTYMPLDTNDRVRLPEAWLDMNELLPSDQRYYQFMGSLTTPPCTEGVLWMVLKQPVRISAAQFKLFSQLFPLNARPVQPVNGRPVREAK